MDFGQDHRCSDEVNHKSERICGVGGELLGEKRRRPVEQADRDRTMQMPRGIGDVPDLQNRKTKGEAKQDREKSDTNL